MTVKEYDAGESIYDFKEHRKGLFIVIRGKVQLTQKNKEDIPNWQWAIDAYQSLCQWKQKFDQRVEDTMNEQLVRVKIQTNLRNLMKMTK